MPLGILRRSVTHISYWLYYWGPVGWTGNAYIGTCLTFCTSGSIYKLLGPCRVKGKCLAWQCLEEPVDSTLFWSLPVEHWSTVHCALAGQGRLGTVHFIRVCRLSTGPECTVWNPHLLAGISLSPRGAPVGEACVGEPAHKNFVLLSSYFGLGFCYSQSSWNRWY